MSFWKLVRWGGFSVLSVVICVVLIYIFGFFGGEETGFNWGKPWDLTGFSGTKLWYWLNLLLVPAVLAISVFLLNRAQSERQQATEEQRARNAALQAYLDHVGGLLADKKLSASQPDEDARTVARARTLTVLNSLAPAGKRDILQFLYQSNLISKEQTIVDIEEANLSRANLGRAVLSEVNLSRVILSGANLGGAVLRKADLSEAMLGSYEMLRTTLPSARSTMFEGDLSSASMSSADLNGADLRGANLCGAKLLGIDLRGPDLRGVNLFEADLRRVILSNADLSETNLCCAKLFGADLRGSDLNRAKLFGTDLSGADLRGADLHRSTGASDADLRGADLRGADLHRTDMSYADRGAELDGTDSVTSSSRDSLAGAGWFFAKVGGSTSAGWPFSWINPVSLWRSRNKVLADYLRSS